MALTLSRWIALAVVACLLVPVLVFREPPGYDFPRSERERLQQRADLAVEHARAAAERYHIVNVANSLRASVPRSAQAPTTVTYDRAFDAETRKRLEDLTADALIDRTTTPLVNVDVRFVLDTIPVIERNLRRGFGGAMTMDYVLPASVSDRCLVVARIQPRLGAELMSDIARERLLGPCAYYQAFGIPGARVESWFRHGGWQLAQTGQWEGEIRKWAGMRWFEVDKQPLRFMIGPQGFRCATGSDSLCVESVMRPRIRFFKVAPNIISTSDHNPYATTSYWYAREWSFGPRAPYFMADMVRDLGPERFARFWQSDREVPEAFRVASGSDLAWWARSWVTRVYHAEETGPWLSAGQALLAVSLLLLGVLLSVRLAQVRQMA